LQIQLRELDSVLLAQRFARQIHWTLSNLETVSKEAAPALSQYKQFFDLRPLTVLDSPAVARALAKSRSELSLPRLRAATPEVIEILKLSENSTYILP
jgi:hypothetical protein